MTILIPIFIHLQTQNAKPVSLLIPSHSYIWTNQSLCRPQSTHHHHLILAHRPHHHAQRQTLPRRLCVRLYPHPPSIPFSPPQKMQLRTLTRSPRPRHRRRQPQTRRPHRHLPQTHHHRQQREGNSHAAYVFCGGLCGGAVQVWHRCVGEGGVCDDNGSGVAI